MKRKIAHGPGTQSIEDLQVPPSKQRRVGLGKTPTALAMALAILFALVSGVLPLVGRLAVHASDDRAPTIQKTFDYETLIEHTISVTRGPYLAALHLSQRRQAENSPMIIRSNLAYQHRVNDGHPAMPASLFEPLLADLIRAMHEHFGADLALESVGSGGFMGVKEIEKRSILAFADYEPWQRYLQNPKSFSQLEIYTLVKEHWQAAGVFAPATDAFAPLGYPVSFSGFEKLFVFPAGKCSFYQELAPLGIKASDRFPYPGSISFTPMPNP